MIIATGVCEDAQAQAGLLGEGELSAGFARVLDSESAGVPRVISVQRNRVEPGALDLGSLLAPGHPARTVSAFLQALAQPPLYGRIELALRASGRQCLERQRAFRTEKSGPIQLLRHGQCTRRADLGRPGVQPLAHATPEHRLRNLIPGRQVSASAARTPCQPRQRPHQSPTQRLRSLYRPNARSMSQALPRHQIFCAKRSFFTAPQWTMIPPATPLLPARAGGSHRPHTKWRMFS
jgi:hypothetical protein